MRRLTVVCLAFALLASLALIGLALLAPAYTTSETSSSSSDGTRTVREYSQTLVAAEGASVLIVLAIPLVVSLAVSAALWLGRRRTAWVLTGALGCFAVLGLASIGLFVLPAVLALALACGTGQPRAVRSVATG